MRKCPRSTREESNMTSLIHLLRRGAMVATATAALVIGVTTMAQAGVFGFVVGPGFVVGGVAPGFVVGGGRGAGFAAAGAAQQSISATSARAGQRLRVKY